jgi:hypothetical protein
MFLYVCLCCTGLKRYTQRQLTPLLLLLLLSPGPRYKAFFGNLPEFKKHGSHEFMVACRARYGPVFKVGR